MSPFRANNPRVLVSLAMESGLIFGVLYVLALLTVLINGSLAPTGSSAICFMFAGHPILIVGVVLAFVALTRRLRRESAAAHEPE